MTGAKWHNLRPFIAAEKLLPRPQIVIRLFGITAIVAGISMVAGTLASR
jgi:hypothetical protein